MSVESILQAITAELRPLPFVRGVVLGGSRATQTASEHSDIDVGVYYDGFDLDQLNAIARRLDDSHRENLVCREGGWGNWVNCGGWLAIEGTPVDLILRDCRRVEAVVESSESGRFSAHYQPGHPHAFLDVMYRGELACCRTLYAADAEFEALKRRAERYPAALKSALIGFFPLNAAFPANRRKRGCGAATSPMWRGTCFGRSRRSTRSCLRATSSGA